MEVVFIGNCARSFNEKLLQKMEKKWNVAKKYTRYRNWNIWLSKEIMNTYSKLTTKFSEKKKVRIYFNAHDSTKYIWNVNEQNIYWDYQGKRAREKIIQAI